jgi:DNA helicase-2/ATP-dependent DNA helicase PcrA
MTHVGTRQIFGSTRLGRPSRFLATIPADASVHKVTRAANQASRYIDRTDTFQRPPHDAWRHPFERESARAPARPAEPGERFVDRDYFDDGCGSDSAVPIRRGSRVLHAQFGEGEVQRVLQASEPAVMVFFPALGEKKVLARFLRRA